MKKVKNKNGTHSEYPHHLSSDVRFVYTSVKSITILVYLVKINGNLSEKYTNIRLFLYIMQYVQCIVHHPPLLSAKLMKQLMSAVE